MGRCSPTGQLRDFMATASVQVMIAAPKRILFNGTARSVSVPGEQGTFEILPLHRPLVSRLLAGPIVIDGKAFFIRRGVARVADDIVVAVVELP